MPGRIVNLRWGFPTGKVGGKVPSVIILFESGKPPRKVIRCNRGYQLERVQGRKTADYPVRIRQTITANHTTLQMPQAG